MQQLLRVAVVSDDKAPALVEGETIGPTEAAAVEAAVPAAAAGGVEEKLNRKLIAWWNS